MIEMITEEEMYESVKFRFAGNIHEKRRDV